MTFQKCTRNLAAIGVLLAAAPAFTAEKPAVAPAVSAPQVEQAIYDYIMAHPDVILQSVRAFDERKKEAAKAELRQKVKSNLGELHSNSPSVGAGDAADAVTIVEFFDYRCGYCKKVAPTVAGVLKTPGVRVVYKDLPILGPDSLLAAKAALAAGKQGKYTELHDAMFDSAVALNEAVVMKLAAGAGIDVERLKKDMESPEVVGAITRNFELAEKLGVQATPAFVVGTELAPGALDPQAFAALIAQARQKVDMAKAEPKAGF